MLRINAELISDEANTYYYRGEPFTGVVFMLNGCEVERAIEVKGGKLQGAYSNELFSSIQNLQKVDSDCLFSEDEGGIEPYCYKGDRFTGIAYDFDGEFCTGERYILEGWLESEVGYYKSGKLAVVDLAEENFAQRYQWYECGQLEQCRIFERDSFEVNFAFTDQGEVTELSVDGDYFNRYKSIKTNLRYDYFADKDFAKSLFGAETLFISGSGINEEIFEDLLANNGLLKTSKITIFGTSIGSASLDKLVSIQNITKCRVISEILSLKDMQAFKQQRPDCFVEYNRAEVTI